MKKILFFLFIVPLVSRAQVSDGTKREVKLQGAVNFRDLGGYVTKDGHHVKWGKLYRSAALNKLTEADLQKLHGLSIAWVADFRGPFEVQAAPDKLPVEAVRVSLPAGSETIGDSNYAKNMLAQMKDQSGLTSFYSEINPFPARYEPVFKEMLALDKDSALLFHCTAGKDRTGIAAALILYALGVDEETIMQDYLATNYYRASDNGKAIGGMVKMYGLDEATAKNLMAAKEDYLNATFAAIRSKYGSVENYLEKEMGLGNKEIVRLKEMYLE